MTILRSSVIAFLCLLSLTNAASSVTQTPLDTVENFSEKWGWKDCGSFCIILSGYLLLAFIHSHTIGMETDPIQIQSIEISPDPPLPGKPLTVKVTGTASEVIEEGATADVTVKLGLIKLLTKTFDVCEEARSANASVQCPVEKGQYIVEQTVDLPKEIPPAKFNIHIDGYTVDEDDLMCMDLTIDFTKKHFW
ncbi:MAG: ML domain-containing protein [Lentinula lateritia]|nr:MAG: ML domain-containing protein [Lentinula lateritia]